MGKRKCCFNDDLKKKYPSFKKGKVDWEVICTICDSTLSISNKGGSDILDHISTKKHKTNLQSISSTSKLTDTFHHKQPNIDKIRATEGALAFHTIDHHMSFNSLDCTVALSRKLFFDSKIVQQVTCNRTKATAIITNVLAPLSISHVIQELNHTSYISVSTDTSNHGSCKLLLIMIQYFNSKGKGITSKILGITSLKNETSDTIFTSIVNQLEKHKILSKCVAYGADNCNTNFGGRERIGTNNVFTKLQQKLSRKVIGVGCPAHIINNAVHHGCDVLPLDIESVVMKIYNYFSIYTVRTEDLKEFCIQAEVQHSQLLYHSKTRWLSLFPAIERLLTIYKPLKDYFLEQEKPPQVLVSFFTNIYSEIYLFLIHSTMCIFHTNIEKIERECNSILEVRKILNDITNSLKNRIEQNYQPIKIRELLGKLEAAGEHTDEFLINGKKFYNEIIQYIMSWMNPLQELGVFDWMDLSRIDKFGWKDVESSLFYLKARDVHIDDAKLFEEWEILKTFCQTLSVDDKKLNINNLWMKFINACKSEESYSELKKIVEFFFSIPAHNANVERVFSLINCQWTKERNKLLPSNIAAITMTKYNFSHYSCDNFYDYLLNNCDVLRQIGKTEKYETVLEVNDC